VAARFKSENVNLNGMDRRLDSRRAAANARNTSCIWPPSGVCRKGPYAGYFDGFSDARRMRIVSGFAPGALPSRKAGLRNCSGPRRLLLLGGAPSGGEMGLDSGSCPRASSSCQRTKIKLRARRRTYDSRYGSGWRYLSLRYRRSVCYEQIGSGRERIYLWTRNAQPPRFENGERFTGEGVGKIQRGV